MFGAGVSDAEDGLKTPFSKLAWNIRQCGYISEDVPDKAGGAEGLR